MDSPGLLAQIAVDQTLYHFDKPFDYLVPAHLTAGAKAGCRVLVPFGGGNRKRQGMILSLTPAPEGKSGFKQVESVIDRAPLLSDEMLRLVFWLKETTYCTLYDGVRLMLPAGINYKVVSYYAVSENWREHSDSLTGVQRRLAALLQENGPATKEELEKRLGPAFADAGLDLLCKTGVLCVKQDAVRRMGDACVRMVRLEENWEDAFAGKLSAKQAAVVQLLSQVGAASVKELCYFLGVTAAVVQALVKKKVCRLYDQEAFRNPYRERVLPSAGEEITLTGDQQRAYDSLVRQFQQGGGTALLFGVTGSGKTAVFLALIQFVLQAGRDVIVMVPEIALTPQVIHLFQRRFGDAVAVFHSGLSIGERMDEWKRVKKGKARIAIGTRSAVFAPMERLGLIVMDEEQEYTYKSEASPRFHARDVARFRGKYHNALLLLSSATPSIETFYAAQQGKYALCRLDSRYGGAALPAVDVVDMNDELRGGNTAALSRLLTEELQNNLALGRQSILLLNRRGYHTFASCKACNTVLTCPHCSISMTYHSANKRLMCHYCGYSIPLPKECPACHRPEIKYTGLGTQRAEEELQALFPQARILRMDTDTTMARFSHETKLKAFANGEYDIMIGTQMVAKGLDFPNVTLVGVLSADQSLYSDDYRGYERAFSLLTQVVGRSGRGGEAGRAIIQTTTPENPVIQMAAQQAYEAFYQDEIALRRARLYPPFADICIIGFAAPEQRPAQQAARCFLDMLTKLAAESYPNLPLRVIGPSEAGIFKVNNKYRYKIMIKCKNNKSFRGFLAALLEDFGSRSAFSKVSIYADMNPDYIL